MKKILILATIAFLMLPGCDKGPIQSTEVNPMGKADPVIRPATFAGGCFWCVQSDFRKAPGVVKVVSGYTGGEGETPTYETYAESGHVEAVQVWYDPARTSYERLLDVFWRHIDPTDASGQFADRGPHYRSVIFYHDAEQRRAAERSRAALGQSGRFSRPIATEILAFTRFYAAEAYHQDYDRKNPLRYRAYRYGSGRERFLEETWKTDAASETQPETPDAKPDEATLRKRLTALQYRVTQEEAPNRPFRMRTGTTSGRGSTWTSFPENPSSVPGTSTIPARAGPASPDPSRPAGSSKRRTGARSCGAPRSGAGRRTPTSATSSRTGRSPPVCVTA
ncbi:MAG: peptide-methionine (S)-S-oxide reductase MsrA [Syntrophales bacterium]